MSKYFVYDSYGTGFEEFETLEEAEKHFEEITDFSSYSDGWPQEILDGAIKLGIITHVSCDGEHRHTDHKEWDFECDVVQAEVLDNPMSLLQQELQKTREHLGKAIKSAEFFMSHADCKRDSWACKCSFCRDTESSKNLREARQYFQDKDKQGE